MLNKGWGWGCGIRGTESLADLGLETDATLVWPWKNHISSLKYIGGVGG